MSKRIYTKILGLSNDKTGLKARTNDMNPDEFFTINEQDMNPYQKKIFVKLTTENDVDEDTDNVKETMTDDLLLEAFDDIFSEHDFASDTKEVHETTNINEI